MIRERDAFKLSWFKFDVIKGGLEGGGGGGGDSSGKGMSVVGGKARAVLIL